MIGLHRFLCGPIAFDNLRRANSYRPEGATMKVDTSSSQSPNRIANPRTSQKGTNGRHLSPRGYNSRPDGDFIGDLITLRGAARFAEKGRVGFKREDTELSRVQWSQRR
jgi:hypothetical protein